MLKIFSSLRSRLALIIILTAVPGILLLVQVGVNQREAAKQDTLDEVIHLAKVASSVEALIVEDAKSFLLTVSHLPTVRERDYEECNAIFRHMFEEHFDYYSAFYVADLEGNILCSPPEKHAPPNFEECDHYQNLIYATDFTLSGYHICRVTGKAVMSVGYPVYDMQDVFFNVANVSLDLIWFYDFAEDAGLPEGGELIVMDEAGTILSHYPDNDRWRGYRLPDSNIVAQLWNQKSGYLIGEGLSGEETIYAISAIQGTSGNLSVIMGLPTRIAFETANFTLQRNLIIMVVVVFLVLIFMWFLGDALIIRQATALVQATQKLAKGDLTARSGISYKQGELGQLAQSFDNMADEIAEREADRDRYESELKEYTLNLEHSNEELRNFTNVASHDLQEPLRKIQTFGEMLQDRYSGQLDPRGMNYLQRMRDAAARMQLLLSETLTFSRSINKEYQFSKVKLEQVIRQVLIDLDWQVEQRQANVEISELPTLEGDAVQLSQLFQNLISNALKFHSLGRQPQINIYSPYPKDVTDNEGMCEIRIQDNGIGFKEKYLDRIFQPFQRLDDSGEYPGIGMGLTICRKIVDNHGGTISAHSSPGKGTTFVVRLPKVQYKERLNNHENDTE
jgi:signal transduction histidine kinase